MVRILQTRKRGLDSLVMGFGHILAETIMGMERGCDQAPKTSLFTKL
jgi:hypothetical protein